MTCLLRHKLLGWCPQSHRPPTKPYELCLEVLWSLSHFTCSSLILAGKYLLCCKNNGRFTQLLIILRDDRPRLTYFWKHTCLCSLPVQKYLLLISLSEHDFFFFLNFIWLSLSCGHFWEPKCSCQVGFHLEEESNSTESACIFKHSLVCLHDAFILLPWTKVGTKWFVRQLFLKRGISAPFWEPSILPHVLPRRLTGWWWQFWGSFACIISQFKFLIWNTFPVQTTKARFLKIEWVDLTWFLIRKVAANKWQWVGAIRCSPFGLGKLLIHFELCHEIKSEVIC